MFGMIKNSLFGNTEETEYKLLSAETKVGPKFCPCAQITHSDARFALTAFRNSKLESCHWPLSCCDL